MSTPAASGPSAFVAPHTAKPTPTAVARSSGTVAVMSIDWWKGHDMFVRKLRTTYSDAANVNVGAITMIARQSALPQSAKSTVLGPPSRRSAHGMVTRVATERI